MLASDNPSFAFTPSCCPAAAAAACTATLLMTTSSSGERESARLVATQTARAAIENAAGRAAVAMTGASGAAVKSLASVVAGQTVDAAAV